MTVNLLAVKEQCLSATHPFLLKQSVSRAEKEAEVMFSVCDTPLMASFHVSWRHFGSGHVFSVRDTLFWRKKTVSRIRNQGKTCHFVNDTPFLLKQSVSRAEKGAEVMFSVCDTPLMASFHVSWRHFGSGQVFSVRDTPFWRKKPVSRIRNQGKTCHFVRDTLYFFR